MNRTGASGTFDVLIVGSGINSLVCAALLARKGQAVCVLECNDVAGGCIRTEEPRARRRRRQHPLPGRRRWAADLRERYADRIIERLCAQLPGLRASIVGRCVLSPADLERLNINLVGGCRPGRLTRLPQHDEVVHARGVLREVRRTGSAAAGRSARATAAAR